MSFPRHPYRTTSRRRPITVTVVAPDGTSVEGEAQDLSANGTGAVFPRGDGPELDVGTVVELAFDAFLLMKPVLALAVVRGRRETEESLRLSFEFTDPNAVLSQVPYVMQREFNRRANPRTMIEEPVMVAFRSLGLPAGASGRLMDLSKGGLGLRLDAEVGEKLAIGHRVELGFVLPGMELRIELTATVRNLRRAGQSVVSGLQFEEEVTEDFYAKTEAIGVFVEEQLKSQEQNGAASPSWGGPDVDGLIAG